MKVLWSTNSQWGSRLIRWGFGDDCSHVAVQFGERVYESRMQTGVVQTTISDFLSRNTVVHSRIFVDCGAESIVRMKTGRRYDFKAILWWAACALGRRITGRLPDHNQWSDRKEYFCVEVLEGVERVMGVPDIDLHMERPHTLWEKVKP